MGSDIKRFLCRLACFILAIALCTGALFLAATKLPSAYFRNSYQYAINLKYDHLMRTEGPKIIIVGGSNCAFGIDGALLEERTGMPVCNMGLHVEFGGRFNTEVSLPGVEEGDLVVLCYEYNILSHEDGMQAELIATGIEDHYSLYRLLSAEQLTKIIRYFPTYVFKKLELLHTPLPESSYSLSYFDEKGQMILDRPACVLPEGELSDWYGAVTEEYLQILAANEAYVDDFVRRVRERGGQVVISFPPILDERMECTEENIAAYEAAIDAQLDVPRISRVSDYIFPRELMYDTIYHCNNAGEHIRTEKLADDIIAYLEETHVPE